MHGSFPAVAGLLLATGCTLSSNPNADSVGRTAPGPAGERAGLRPPVAGAPTVEITAPIEAKFDRTSYAVDARTFNVAFSSAGNHNLNLVGPGVVEPLLWGADAGTVEDRLTYSVTLQPGTFTFYCSVQGHRAAGMEGTLTVS